MAIQERKSTITPTRYQLERLRTKTKPNVPKRRVALEALKRRPLELQLELKLREQKQAQYFKEIEDRLMTFFDKDLDIFTIDPNSPLIIGKSEKDNGMISIRLGTFRDPINNQPIKLIMRLRYTKKGDHYILFTSMRGIKRELTNSKIFQQLNIPVVKPIPININYKYLKYPLITEDLTQNGKYKLKEAHDFDFRKLKNGPQLARELDDYVKRILKRKPTLVGSASHSENPNYENEIKRCFFVVIDPKTNIGKVVASDLDHIVFNY